MQLYCSQFKTSLQQSLWIHSVCGSTTTSMSTSAVSVSQLAYSSTHDWEKANMVPPHNQLFQNDIQQYYIFLYRSILGSALALQAHARWRWLHRHITDMQPVVA